MGKLPALLIGAIALWLAVDVYRNGPNAALSGIVDLLHLPQYGEADAPTKSGDLADRMFETEDEAIRAPGEDEE